jgi:hypothetical protein
MTFSERYAQAKKNTVDTPTENVQTVQPKSSFSERYQQEKLQSSQPFQPRESQFTYDKPAGPQPYDPSKGIKNFNIPEEKPTFFDQVGSFFKGVRSGSGVYNPSNNPTFLPAALAQQNVDKIVPTKKGTETAETAGNIAGTLTKYGATYGALGPAVEAIPILGAINNPIAKTLITEGAKDIAIGAPLGAIDAVNTGKQGKELSGEIGKNFLMDSAANAAFYGLGKGASAIVKKIKGGQILTEAKKAAVKANPTITNPANDLKGKAELLKTKTTPKTEVGRELFIVSGKKERGFSANTRTDLNNPDKLRNSFSENPITYDQISNKDTIAKAQAIFNKGNANAELYTSFGKGEFKPENVPLSKMIARDLTAKGDIQGARNVLSDMSVKLTEAGQFSQAAKLLRESDPETFLMTVDKQLNKLNESGAKQYGQKWNNIDLTPEELKGIQNLPRGDEVAYESMMNQIGDRISQQLPSSSMEKFDAWRRMAMLLNPKTHIRNIGGNTMMAGLRKTADSIGAAMEKVFVPVGERTKSVGWSADQNIVSKVNLEWETAKKDLFSNSRYDIEIGNLKALGREKPIFKNNVLNKLDNISKDTLNWEDNIFAERAYKDAIGGYMKANNLNEVTDAARQYATRRAEEATFKQANDFAAWLTKQKSKGGIIGKGIDAAIPFVKTPLNIAVNSFEYSPAGIIKTLFQKDKSAAAVIETLSKGLTGSAVAVLGYYLSSMGWARSEKGKSKNAEGLLQESGSQPYSIQTPLGSYTFDWAQPLAVPFAMGMSVFQSLAKNENIDLDSIGKAIATGGDTIFNMSMLQNIKQLMGGGYGSATEQIMQLPVSYIEQAFPTAFGQVARTVDDTKRSTYDTSGIGKFTRQIASKVPFVSKTLEPNLDIWGEEQSNGGAVQQFISPGYIAGKNNDPVTLEVKRVYDATNETDFLPKLATGKFSLNGKDIALSPQQLTRFQREMGQKNYKDISNLIKDPFYIKANDEAKAKMIGGRVNSNYEIEKRKFIPSNKTK